MRVERTNGEFGLQDPKTAPMPVKQRKPTRPQLAPLQGLPSNSTKRVVKTVEKTPKGQMVPFSRGHREKYMRENGTICVLAFSPSFYDHFCFKSSHSPKKKQGKSNKITTRLITGIGLKLCKNDDKTGKNAKRTNSAVHLWGRSGRGHCRIFFRNLREISANFPQNFRTLS